MTRSGAASALQSPRIRPVARGFLLKTFESLALSFFLGRIVLLIFCGQLLAQLTVPLLLLRVLF